MIPLTPVRQDREQDKLNDPSDFRMPMMMYGLYEMQAFYKRYQSLSNQSWGQIIKPRMP